MTTQPNATTIQVLMVCLGNICRSPTAHGVFYKLIQSNGLEDNILVDSAGTGDWHIGESPDARAVHAAASRGYRIDGLRARQVSPEDFEMYDYILAMDRTNLRELKNSCPDAHQRKLQLLLQYATAENESVPDPYYSGSQGFEQVLDLVEEACDQLLQHIKAQHFSAQAAD
ncbi:MAG TPA: low molecular weight protein-tyrosine-phosphatase [Gammaproteobacteria bacterium]|nr:low molecular weight protein-tyrosine-phosphatase [Gammaproteobacteria bacterium]